MIIAAIVSIADATNWDPAVLTAEALVWPPSGYPLIPLREVAIALLADAWSEPGSPVITPASIDRSRGGVRKRDWRYRGSVYQVRARGRGLQPGDVLVPMNPQLPALFVRPEHLGAHVASTFLALRPASGQALWIWAVLSSESGHVFREQLATTSASTSAHRAALLDLELPVPLEVDDRRLSDIQHRTYREEDEAPATWWRTVDLATIEWSLALATPNPELLDDGIPLGDLCSEITKGRRVPADARGEGPSATPLFAEPGDVLVSAIGRRGRARVVIGTEEVGSNVFRLRLHDLTFGEFVVRHLNSQVGVGLRQILTSGLAAESLSRDRLARLPVPVATLRDVPADGPAVSLRQELEQEIWPS